MKDIVSPKLVLLEKAIETGKFEGGPILLQI